MGAMGRSGTALPAPAEAPDPAGGFDPASAASVIIGLVFVVIVGWIVVTVRRRLDEIRLREEIAASLFEVEVLASLGGGAALSNEFETAKVSAASVQAPEEGRIFAAPEQRAPSPAISPYLNNDEPERADVAAAGALTQLRNAGMAADVEGYIELNGNAHGAVTVKLKDGRRALVVPYHETEAFTRRNLRRFDLLIYVGRDGKAAVVTSLESLIAEKVGGRM